MTDIGTSQNGWTVYDDANHGVVITAGGRNFRVANPWVGYLFRDFINWFDDNIEPVSSKDTQLDDWSKAIRPVRGKTTGYSNHASATAIDINALKHPRGVHNTFSAADARAIRNRLKRYRGAIRWGGDFITTVDDMHFEINKDPQDVRDIVEELEAARKAAAIAKENELPTVKEVWDTKDELIGQTPAGALKALLLRTPTNTKERLDNIDDKLDAIIKAIAIPEQKEV